MTETRRAAKPPTIGAVAREAGVALSTVSRALNGGYVSVELKQHIERVMKRLGYSPWSTARNFKLGKSGAIGVTVENSGSAWFMQLLMGIESELRPQRHSLQLGSLELDGAYDSTVVASWIEERRVDGLVFVRAGKRERALVQAAKRAKVPIALIAPDEEFDYGHVFRTRNRDAGRDAAEHLLSLGHRRFGFCGGPKASRDTRDRLAGFADGLVAKGLTLNRENTHYGERYDSKSGAKFAEEWLARGRSRAPTALLFGNDSLALGFVGALQREGVEVPAEVSVIGVDDVPEAGLHWPALTTLRQPLRELGAAACKAVLRGADAQAGASTSLHEFSAELVVRESCAPPPSGRR